MSKSISIDAIQEVETQLKIEFPAVFRANMCKSNGGEVKIDGEPWWLFPFRDSSSRRNLVRTAEDILRATKQIPNNIGFPEDGIVIGENGAGDFLFLRKEGEYLSSKVWFFRIRGPEMTVALSDVGELWAT